jgi:prolyl 4-hydroxylase
MTGALDAARELFAAGRAGEGVALVEQAAAKGDAESLFALANWRLFGLNGPRDPAAAQALFGKAAALGHGEAARSRAYLTAAGIGTAADPKGARAMLEAVAHRDADAAAQLDLLARMAPAESAAAAPRTPLCDAPAIMCVRGLFTEEECAWLRQRALPALQPSFVVDPASRRRMPHPVRSSWGAPFGPTQEDLVVNALNRRIHAASGTAYACGEPLHMLRYLPGQEYRLHLDALPGAANQRGWTAIAYLNHGYEGGETVFPELGIEIRGRAGDLLLFRNVTEDGSADPRSRHAGLPLCAGEKWIATRWIRMRSYDPWEG